MRVVKRSLALSCAVTGLLAFAVPASAQTASNAQEPSVASYLCTFAGQCDGQPAPEAVTKDAPATKGFRLARSAPAQTEPTQAAPATKGFRLARAGQPAEPTKVAETAPATKGFRIAKAPVAATTTTRRTPGRTQVAEVTTTRHPAVESVGRGQRADLSIGFEFGSDRMTDSGVATAKIFQQSLMSPALSSKRFLIEGHTDSVGDAARNLDLSRRRAQAVADYLIGHGVDSSRLEVKGRGSEEPLPGHRKADPANRRVEAALIS
jgi:outer membrane protein OmpA-like peptidoglycan-associated protein